MKERLLFISHRIPYPPNKGDKIRSYHLLKFLSNRYEVDLAFLVDDRDDLQYVEWLRPLVNKIAYERIVPRFKKLSCLLSLPCHDTISTCYFYSSRLQRTIDSWIRQRCPDHLFCFSSPTAEYVFRSGCQHELKGVNLLMDLIDVDSLKWRQYAKESGWPMRYIYSREATGLAAYEERIAREFDHLLLVSRAERDIFLKTVAGNVHALSNGVDLRRFSPEYQAEISLSDPAIVFTGAMDYRPNGEGVSWFVREVLPGIWKMIPEAVFYIVGSRPTLQVKKLAQQEGVVVTGYVEEIRDYLAAATLCVAPLKVARGIQNKVLEGMAMGKSVVCTPQALEGIMARADRDVAVAGTAPEFSRVVIDLIREGSKRRVMGENGRRCVERDYSWSKNLAGLSPLLERQ